MEPYRHAPLRQPDAIRLMTLHPGDESSSIRISLREVCLGTQPRYEALSYTWATEDGDDRRSRFIECEGGELSVTKNCEAALRRLRGKDGERILWIDAICIDQDNINERNHQVQLMKEVYSTAHQVIIWLGEASTDLDEETGPPVSDIYMEYLDHVASQIVRLREEGKKGSASPFYQKLESEAYEFALNKVGPRHCGGASKIYITDAGGLVSGLFKKRLFPSQLFWSVGLKQLHMDVSDFLMLTRYLKSSDPRDHVFGLLGISEAMKDALPSPDYNKSAVWLFTEVAKTLMNGMDSIDLLWSASNVEGNNTLELPSWVPDWSNPPILEVPFEVREGIMYNAARNSKAKFEIEADTQELKALGNCFDNLAQMPIVDLKAYDIKSTTFEQMLGWQASCRLGLSLLNYPTGEAPRSALWRTLCWNLGSLDENPSPNENAEFFEAWYVRLMNGKWLEGEAMDPEDPFYSLVEGLLAPVCITAKGYLASVPYTTKRDDCIAILTGGGLPFVLRPIGVHYRLIGPCYVHGIMNGEAFTDDESELEWFSIR